MHGGFHGYMLNRERRWSRAWEQFRMNVKHLFNVVEESEQNRKKKLFYISLNDGGVNVE